MEIKILLICSGLSFLHSFEMFLGIEIFFRFRGYCYLEQSRFFMAYTKTKNFDY